MFGWVSCWSLFCQVLDLLLYLQASLGPSRSLVGKLSHRAEDGVGVSREMVVVFLGYASIGWIWCGSIGVAPPICGVVWAIFVRILCDRHHRMSPYLGVENFRSQLLVTWCIRNAVLDRCPHIPSFEPRSLDPCRCCRCHPLGLALVVSCWLRYGATFRHSSFVYVLPLRLM